MLAQTQIRIIEIVVDIQYLLPIARSRLIVIFRLGLQTGVDQRPLGSGGKDFNRLVHGIHHYNLIVHKAEAGGRVQQTLFAA